MKRDKAKTLAANFQDPRSYVAPDDREVLYGPDWTARKNQLWQRANGRCEQLIKSGTEETGFTHARCRSEAHDPHHMRPRSKGRDDRLSNLLALCRMHHDLLDKRKPQWSKR
jgi:hypothetical protein